MNLREAAQRLLQALDAALPYAPHRSEFDVVADAADDLRIAMAEPTVKEYLPVEPAAWGTMCNNSISSLSFTKTAAQLRAENLQENVRGRAFRISVRPLYFAPLHCDALLEALKEIVAAADGSGWDQLDASFAKARAAIAAAGGKI